MGKVFEMVTSSTRVASPDFEEASLVVDLSSEAWLVAFLVAAVTLGLSILIVGESCSSGRGVASRFPLKGKTPLLKFEA